MPRIAHKSLQLLALALLFAPATPHLAFEVTSVKPYVRQERRRPRWFAEPLLRGRFTARSTVSTISRGQARPVPDGPDFMTSAGSHRHASE